jgi:predicted RNA-binding protein YlqC (UPF0109 family)
MPNVNAIVAWLQEGYEFFCEGPVVVTSKEGEHSVIIEVRAQKPDIGQIIGKQGRRVEAMREFLKAIDLDGRRIVLEVLECR